MGEIKENDVYRWSWKEGRKPIIGCYAHLAVARSGELYDTFWHDWEFFKGRIDLDRVELTLLGNIDECDPIAKWQKAYYEPADVIDMSHSNNSNAPVFLKRSAVKNQARMLEFAEEKERQARRDKDRAERELVQWADKVARIKSGDLEVYL